MCAHASKFVHVYNSLDGDLTQKLALAAKWPLYSDCKQCTKSKFMSLTVHSYQYAGYIELKSHDWLVLPLAETMI